MIEYKLQFKLYLVIMHVSNEQECENIYKAAIIPWVRIDGRIFYILARASHGGYGYLGGTSEKSDIDIAHTAAREFNEELKNIFNTTAIREAIKNVPSKYIIEKMHRKIPYYFYVVPWSIVSPNMSPAEAIYKWDRTAIEGSEYNEKEQVALISNNDIRSMAHTVRMVINRINILLENLVTRVRPKRIESKTMFDEICRNCKRENIYVHRPRTSQFNTNWRNHIIK